MTERLFGVETEYAFAVIGRNGRPLSTEPALLRLLELARARLPCLGDEYSHGIFLANGARLYIDCGLHLEMTTPECTSPWDIVRYILAGEKTLSLLAADVKAGDPAIGEVLLVKSNVDYSSSTTWGCHESYLHRCDPRGLPEQMIPHLVSRIVYTGAGGFNSTVPQLEFTVSPRVWHLRTKVSQDSTHHRGIFHTKDEPLSSNGYHRLHLLCGESLCSHTAMWLRTATTAAVVALIDGGVPLGREVALASPLRAMRLFAGDPECKSRVQTTDGNRVSALDIQRYYLEKVEAHMHDDFMPSWTPEACQRWREILDCIERAPQALATRLDWAIKQELYSQHARRRGVDWAALPATTLLAPRENKRRPVAPLRNEFCEIDVRFGQIGQGKGIFESLDRAGVLNHRVPGVDRIENAMEDPPATGRAKVRGQCIRRLAGERSKYLCSWYAIYERTTGKRLDLQDPFVSEESWSDGPQPGPYPLDPFGDLISEQDLVGLLDRREYGHTDRRARLLRRQEFLHRLAEVRESRGEFRVGDRVILGRHDVVDGNADWLPPMEQYVGRVAVITRIGDLDRAGCRTVNVDLDNGQWLWRTRNLRLAPPETTIVF